MPKTYERVADKGYKSVDMFQNWETPITSMEISKSSSMVRRTICHDFEVEPAYYYRYAQSLRSISEKQSKSWRNLIKSQDE
jgi:hypothetical protein